MRKRCGRNFSAAPVAFGLGLMLSCIFPTALTYFLLGVIILWLGLLLKKRC